MRLALLLLVGCTNPPKSQPPREGPKLSMLAALPSPPPINTERFASVVVCDRCHTAGERVMRDARGVDISPVTEVKVTMMSLAARDPYYFAALRREIIANPGAKAVIESICIRCHAPVGFAESNGALALDDLTTATSPAAGLGREGVACAGCHSLSPAGLGTEASFVGKAQLRTDRVAFGALPAPFAEPMVMMANMRPVPSKHISESRLCASCHTVLVHSLDPKGEPTGDEIPEQTTYLEWRNSDFQDEATPNGSRATTCQGCHMPEREDELATSGPTITTPFSTRPPEAPPRAGYRRHTLRGGNSYLLRQLARDVGWLNAGVTAAQLDASAAATDAFLGRSAKLELAGTREALSITVVNETGHKLPTGYPSRRMWLHVVALDAASKPVFESGAARAGALVDGKGKRIDGPGVIHPHRTTIASPDEVVIWEAVPVDAAGNRTHLLLGTASVVKDNRILPAGWRIDHADARRTRAIGVEGDRDFIAGRDTVTVTLPATATTVRVELLYQPIPPETIESYRPPDSLEAARFLSIAAEPPTPVVLARGAMTL